MYNLSMKAHEGPQQPTKADAGPQRWKTAQTMERYVFFLLYIYLFITTKPGKAHSSQRRPTKTKKGPNDARHVVWAIGTCFFKMYYLFFIFLLLWAPVPHLWPGRCPQRPTKAHISQQRPMQAHKDKKGPKRCQMRRLGHRYIFFFWY